MKIPKKGDRGRDITLLQKKLNENGASPQLTEDGDFGDKTEFAVKQFQKKQPGFPGTGKLGPKTMAALGLDVDPKTAPKFTRDDIARGIVDKGEKDVEANFREDKGRKNRSKKIDAANIRVGVPLASAYCAVLPWCNIDDYCKENGLINPIPKTASSQDYRRTSFVPAKYIRAHDELGRVGDAGVLQVVDDSGHGHFTMLRFDQITQPYFKTVEYNTDGSGSRDGDGAYNMTRSTVDKALENSGKKFICFTDIPQWIWDANYGVV